MKWHIKFIQMRKDRRQRALNDHLRNKNMKLTRSCFAHWQRRTSDYIHLQEIAEEIQEEENVEVKNTFLSHWKQQFRSSTILALKADNHYLFRLIQ
jgi:hypothetical protein